MLVWRSSERWNALVVITNHSGFTLEMINLMLRLQSEELISKKKEYMSINTGYYEWSHIQIATPANCA